MASRGIPSLCRQLLKELNVSESQKAINSNTWKHIKTSLRLPSSSNEITTRFTTVDLLKSFIYYVESSTKHRELVLQYQKRGERSVKDSAHLVGLKLPNEQ